MSIVPITTVNQHGYSAAHQPTSQIFREGNFTDYAYDKIGQLQSAKGLGRSNQSAESCG